MDCRQAPLLASVMEHKRSMVSCVWSVCCNMLVEFDSCSMCLIGVDLLVAVPFMLIRCTALYGPAACTQSLVTLTKSWPSCTCAAADGLM